jgi:hypothetical protein
MATNDRVNALGSRALLAIVSLLGASLGVAAAMPGNNTSMSEGRSTLGVAAATRTKVAENRQQKIHSNQEKINTKLKTTGRLAPGTTNTLNPQPLPPGGRQIIWQKKSNPGAAQSLNPQPLPPGGGGEGRSR